MKFYPMATALLLLSGTVAHAGPIVYSFDTDDLQGSLDAITPSGGFNPKGGDVKELSTSFDGTNFTWSYKAAPGKRGKDNDGFWLVVSDGPNPKANPNNTNAPSEYAILYGDFQRNDIVAYVYDGDNDPGSYGNPANYLGTFSDKLMWNIDSDGNTNVSFDIDVSTINTQLTNNEWDGVQFGHKLGVWFHPSVNTNISYLADGKSISGYTGSAGWIDTAGNGPFTTVPEPGMLALLGLGILGMARVRSSSTCALA